MPAYYNMTLTYKYQLLHESNPTSTKNKNSLHYSSYLAIWTALQIYIYMQAKVSITIQTNSKFNLG